MITTKHTTNNVLIILLALLSLFVPSVIFAAATYEPMVGIPGLVITDDFTLPKYINAIYAIVVGLGAVYGVFKIAYIGFKYSLSDSIIGKVDAKSEIGGVILGLFLLLIPYIVLNTINPNLVNMDIFRNLGKVAEIAPSSSAQRVVSQEQIDERTATIISDAAGQPWGTQIEMCAGTREECQGKCNGGTLINTSGTDFKCVVPPTVTRCDEDDDRAACQADCPGGRIEATGGAVELSCIQPKHRPGGGTVPGRPVVTDTSTVIACSREGFYSDSSTFCKTECDRFKGELSTSPTSNRFICIVTPTPNPPQ